MRRRASSRGWRFGLLSGFVVLVSGGVVGAAVGASASGASARAPISIRSDADFATCGCVTSGTGSPTNPYVIGPWTINNVNGTAVDIENVSQSFVLKNLTIAGNASPADIGIHLKNVSGSASVAGSQTSIQKNRVGILVENSSGGVVLDGGGANPNGPGIGSAAGTINKNLDGAIDIENSSHVAVRGWQMSANGGDHLAPDLWVHLDPSVTNWGVGGVRLFGVTNSTIDHNAANNDTDVSYSLFDSSNNHITSNTADYPLTNNVIVSDGSSYNTISGNQFSTADFVGILIADPLNGLEPANYAGPSHDNVVANNVDHTDGPTGAELRAGIAPAFEGGIVVLNGTYDNTITGNQATASSGADLVWAQEVLNAGTPIGIDTAPAQLGDTCNVTQSNGGGGVGNLSGNVWKANVVKKTVSCIPAQLPAP